MQFIEYIDNTRLSWAHHNNKHLAKLQYYGNRNSFFFVGAEESFASLTGKHFLREIYQEIITMHGVSYSSQMFPSTRAVSRMLTAY